MILVAIGANLPGTRGESPLTTCRAAVEALKALNATRLTAVSEWFESEPVPRSDQPNYVNGVARLTHVPGRAITPGQMLAALHAIEDRFGRTRAERNAARVLDLDLIDMDGLVRSSPDPILPHPRAHLRAFVLLPLLTVAPDWICPGLNRDGRSLLNEVPAEGVRRLAIE